MDISPAALVDAALQIKQSNVAQEAQMSLLKKSLDMQSAGVAALMQSVPDLMPLATSGPLGTQVNAIA